jgi:hypothetical protein
MLTSRHFLAKYCVVGEKKGTHDDGQPEQAYGARLYPISPL